MRKIIFGFLGALSVFSCSTFATNTHLLTSGASIDLEFPPHEPQLFQNFLFWTVTTNCVIESENLDNHIHIKIVKKSVTVNNKALKQGDTFSEVIRSSGQLSFIVESGAEVEFTNQDDLPFKATCSM